VTVDYVKYMLWLLCSGSAWRSVYVGGGSGTTSISTRAAAAAGSASVDDWHVVFITRRRWQRFGRTAGRRDEASLHCRRPALCLSTEYLYDRSDTGPGPSTTISRLYSAFQRRLAASTDHRSMVDTGVDAGGTARAFPLFPKVWAVWKLSRYFLPFVLPEMLNYHLEVGGISAQNWNSKHP